MCPITNFQEHFSNIVCALKPGGYMLITMKEGEDVTRAAEGRIFHLWRDEELRVVFGNLNLKVVDFSLQVSKIRETDVWLGYVLKMLH